MNADAIFQHLMGQQAVFYICFSYLEHIPFCSRLGVSKV